MPTTPATASAPLGREMILPSDPDNPYMVEILPNDPVIIGVVVVLLSLVFFFYLLIRRTILEFHDAMRNAGDGEE